MVDTNLIIKILKIMGMPNDLIRLIKKIVHEGDIKKLDWECWLIFKCVWHGWGKRWASTIKKKVWTIYWKGPKETTVTLLCINPPESEASRAVANFYLIFHLTRTKKQIEKKFARLAARAVFVSLFFFKSS